MRVDFYRSGATAGVGVCDWYVALGVVAQLVQPPTGALITGLE